MSVQSYLIVITISSCSTLVGVRQSMIYTTRRVPRGLDPDLVRPLDALLGKGLYSVAWQSRL